MPVVVCFSFPGVKAIQNLYRQTLSLPLSSTECYEQLYLSSCSSCCFCSWLAWSPPLRKTTAAPRPTTSPVPSTPCCATPTGPLQPRTACSHTKTLLGGAFFSHAALESVRQRVSHLKMYILTKFQRFCTENRTFSIDFFFFNCKQHTLYFDAIDTLFYRGSALKLARCLDTEFLDAEMTSR